MQSSRAGLLCLHGRGLYRAGQGKVRFIPTTPTPPLPPFEIDAPPGHSQERKMTSLDPLKTVISIGNQDDTSLALPSVNQQRSGAQRVLEQVQTIRRTKSRQSSRSGSTSLSPTSKSKTSTNTDQQDEAWFGCLKVEMQSKMSFYNCIQCHSL